MVLKVKQNENPYDVIGSYIERHISVIDNIIAVISINGKICNELFLVEISSTSNFVWKTDWWEGEENVELIDFFFVSDACKEDDNNDLISRQAAIKDAESWVAVDEYEKHLQKNVVEWLKEFPSAQPEIIRCKDCSKREICRTSSVWAVAPSDDWFCADAERRTDG